MSHNPQMVSGLPTPYRKYSAVLEFQKPLTEIAIEHPSLLKEAGQKYLAEKGTVFTMSDVTAVDFYRYKTNGKITTGLSFTHNGTLYSVPKFALKPFITRLFGSEAYSNIVDIPDDKSRRICLEGMFDSKGNKEMQLLHNYEFEVFGVASPAYTFIKTVDTAIIAEELIREHFPVAEYLYIFSKQYGFRGFVFDKQQEALQAVGDVRKMLFIKNKHSGRDAFRLIPGLQRLACTNGMTSRINYPGVRLVHLADNAADLSTEVRNQIFHQVTAIDSMFSDLEYSTTISVPFESATLYLRRLPKLPKRIEAYLHDAIARRAQNHHVTLYDIQFVLSYVASNILNQKYQWQKYREQVMDLAGNSIDPDLFNSIVEDQRRKEDINQENEDDFHTVKIA